MSENSSTSATSDRPHRAGAFDLRNFIGALLGIYGVILVITGLVGTSDAEVSKAADININLVAGVALVIGSAVFLVWARLRPVIIPPSQETDDEPPPRPLMPGPERPSGVELQGRKGAERLGDDDRVVARARAGTRGPG